MLHIIINPATGAGRGKRIFDKMRPMFDKAGVRYRVYFSSEEKSVRDIVAELSGKTEASGDITELIQNSLFL